MGSTLNAGSGAMITAWQLWANDARTGKVANYGVDAAQTWHSALPAEWHSSTWVTERTIDFFNQYQTDDQPFCLWVSYPDPHHPFDCPEPWASQHQAADVDISRTHQRDLDQRPWWHRAALENEPQGRLGDHGLYLKGPMLYDAFVDDPEEMHNLWNDASAVGLQQAMLDCVHQRPGPILDTFPEHTE